MNLWRHFLKTIKNQKGFVVSGAVAGTIGTAALLGGAGLAGLFGGKKKQTQQQDFIADIRSRLEGLASEVPALVEKRKNLLREQFGAAEEEGLEDIAGEFRAEKGFGALSSPEVNRRAALRSRIARGLSSAELETEEAGLRQRAGFTQQLSGLQIPEDEPGFGEELVGFGGELLGEEVRSRRLRKLFEDIEGVGEVPRKLKETPTTIRSGDRRSPFLPFEESGLGRR